MVMNVCVFVFSPSSLWEKPTAVLREGAGASREAEDNPLTRASGAGRQAEACLSSL